MSKDNKKNNSETSAFQRSENYKQVLYNTKDPRKATQSYCQGNIWLEQNARAVGNWPK